MFSRCTRRSSPNGFRRIAKARADSPATSSSSPHRRIQGRYPPGFPLRCVSLSHRAASAIAINSCRSLALHGGIGSQDDFLGVAGVNPGQQTLDLQLLWADAAQRRNGAVQNVDRRR